jgi:hypothetical protein
MIELHARAMAAAGNQLDGMNTLFGLRAVAEERIGDDGFVREAPAAGLFPGEVFVEQGDAKART